MSGASDNPQAWGWCPSVLRPMPLSDGLMVRIRPAMGQLSAAQAAGLADLAEAHGAGVIELTNRANLQLRGLDEAEYADLAPALEALGLAAIDQTPSGRVNLALNPLHRAGDLQHRLAEGLSARLSEARFGALPQKFGFLIDAGARRIMAETPADIRFESASDGVLVRPEGAATGRAFADVDQAIAHAIALADWFLASGGKAEDGRGRMRQHLTTTPLPAALAGDTPPSPATPFAPKGPGWLLAGPAGLAPTDLRVALTPKVQTLRLSPFRALYLPDLDAAPTMA